MDLFDSKNIKPILIGENQVVFILILINCTKNKNLQEIFIRGYSLFINDFIKITSLHFLQTNAILPSITIFITKAN